MDQVLVVNALKLHSAAEEIMFTRKSARLYTESTVEFENDTIDFCKVSFHSKYDFRENYCQEKTFHCASKLREHKQLEEVHCFPSAIVKIRPSFQ